MIGAGIPAAGLAILGLPMRVMQATLPLMLHAETGHVMRMTLTRFAQTGRTERRLSVNMIRSHFQVTSPTIGGNSLHIRNRRRTRTPGTSFGQESPMLPFPT